MKYFIEPDFQEHYCDHDQARRTGCVKKEVTHLGYNIPWLTYATRGQESHDGYGNGFHKYYFETEEAEADIKAQLDFFKENGIKFLRLWTCMYHSMNSDKKDVGYTGLREDFKKNLKTFLGWCVERDLRVLLSVDDCWYTFQWSWLTDEKRKAQYLQAYKDIITLTKDLVWGYDYANEPYMGWHWEKKKATWRWFKGEMKDVGVTREQMSSFFQEIYNEGKKIFPKAMFSVGDSHCATVKEYELTNFVDFYQLHSYNADGSVPSVDYDKPWILGEVGGGSDVYQDDMPNAPIIENYKNNGLQKGAKMIMPWGFKSHITKVNGKYIAGETIKALKKPYENPNAQLTESKK